MSMAVASTGLDPGRHMLRALVRLAHFGWLLPTSAASSAALHIAALIDVIVLGLTDIHGICKHDYVPHELIH